jgi:hypothetical protein
MRADFNPNTPLPDVERAMVRGSGGRVVESAMLTTAAGFGSDPLGRQTEPLPILGIGYSAQVVGKGACAAGPAAVPAQRRSSGSCPFATPVSYSSTSSTVPPGGPQGKPLAAGDRLTLTDPRTGDSSTLTIAGILKDGTAFYGVSPGELRFPVLMSEISARNMFGSDAAPQVHCCGLRPARIAPRSPLGCRAVTSPMVSSSLTSRTRSVPYMQRTRKYSG